MNIYDTHFKDVKFSTNLKFEIPFSEKNNEDRITILKKLVSKKNIIHLGCADHLEIIEKKMKHNTWLHKHLNESANKCLGIDINEKSIDFIKQDLGYTNTICANILTDNISAITDQKWDILVLGEILEHIDDPVEFLKNIKAKYQNNIETIIITVPNAFYIDNFYNTVSDVEIINSDHRYWFTPYTLSKIMVSAGIKPTEIYLCQRFPYNTRSLRLKKLFKKWILKKHPYSRNTIIELGCF